MKANLAVLLFLLSTVALAGIIPGFRSTPNPNDIFKKVQFLPLSPLDYAEPEVEVELNAITIGYHGAAYNKIMTLFPTYALYPVWGCRYVTWGLTRFYTFSFKVNSNVKEVNTAVQIEDQNAETENGDDEKEGFLRVSVEWAQQDPRISTGLNYVIRTNYKIVGGRPLRACWSRPIAGLYVYRYYFIGVNGRFEYSESYNAEGQVVDSGSQEKYFTESAPILDVTKTNDSTQYVALLLDELKKHPAYPSIVKLFTEEYGFFDDNWFVRYAGAGSKTSDKLQLVINFKPFLLKQSYEFYYYGDAQKASLLKIDEKVFNQGTSYENWQEIDNFNKLKAFHEAHEYILSQFTWLRHYKVETAYAALHKKGRLVRLSFRGIQEQNIDAGNQINMVIYIDEKGCYYMDRNDFHATHLNSYGRNDWVSLFVSTPDMTKAQYYQRIVKFFQSIYPKFWSANQLEDIKFKDGLHVVKFKNPTNFRYNVLMIDDEETRLMNKIEWVRLEDGSPLLGRLEKYARGKNEDCSKVMFIHYFKDEKGTHFEISYLNKDNQYRAIYVLYIEDTDVFTDDKDYTFRALTFGKYPLPEDVKASINAYFLQNDDSIMAVASFVSLSQTSFAIIAISSTGRWQITVEWREGQWVVVSKQPYNEGYYRAHGYPSASVAAATNFVKKMYPQQFGEGYVYASIETKNVGVSIYIRLVFRFKGDFVEAVIKKLYGVQNSHVLYSWRILSGLRYQDDYGYGKSYNYVYNVDPALLYLDGPVAVRPVVNLRSEAAPVVVSPRPNLNLMTMCPPGARTDLTGGCVFLN